MSDNKIVVAMIGEACNHRRELEGSCALQLEVIELPADAAFSDAYDAEISRCDVLITLKYARNGAKKPSFRMLHVPGAGFDAIDPASLPEGCTVCNVYEHQIPISEYVMTVMLEFELRLSQMRELFAETKWSSMYFSRVPHGEIFGKTLAVIGFGGISREIARRARAFGMRVLAVDKYASDPDGLADELVANDRIDDILREADFVVLACPLTDETRNIIDAHRLSVMKSSAVLINISRGPLVDERALYDALKGGTIAGAAIDVWWRYPKNRDDDVRPSDMDFLSLGNVVCTPHSCAWTKELMERRYAVIAKNIENMAHGEPLKNLVKL